MDKETKISYNLKLLVKSSFIVFIGVVLSKLLTYGYKIAIARNFGPGIYGIFSLATSVIVLCYTISNMGLSEGLLRYVALYKKKGQLKKIKYLLGFSILVSLVFGIFLWLLVFLNAEIISKYIFHDENLVIFLQVMSFTIPLIAVSYLFLSVIRAFEKISSYSFIVNIFQNGIKLLLLLFLILIGLKRGALLTSYFLGAVGFMFLSYLSFRNLTKKIIKQPKVKRGEARKIRVELISYSWPLVFLSVIYVLFTWVDSFLIGFFENASQVGFYNVAISIATLLALSTELFGQLFFPLMVREYAAKNMEVIKELSKQVTKWVFTINLPLFILIFSFPGVFINLLFGEEYLVATTALRILSVGGFISTLFSLGGNLLSMKGKTKLIMQILLFSFVINIILNLMLIPKYGIVGASIGTSISWIMVSLANFFYVRKYVSITLLRRKMLRIILVSIIPSAALIFLSNYYVFNLFELAIIGLLFAAVYLFLLFKTGCLDRNDINILNSIKYKILEKKSLLLDNQNSQ